MRGAVPAGGTGRWRLVSFHVGRRVAIVGAEMEPPLNSACEARGQRALIVPEFSPLEAGGCMHAAR